MKSKEFNEMVCACIGRVEEDDCVLAAVDGEELIVMSSDADVSCIEELNFHRIPLRELEEALYEVSADPFGDRFCRPTCDFDIVSYYGETAMLVSGFPIRQLTR